MEPARSRARQLRRLFDLYDKWECALHDLCSVPPPANQPSWVARSEAAATRVAALFTKYELGEVFPGLSFTIVAEPRSQGAPLPLHTAKAPACRRALTVSASRDTKAVLSSSPWLRPCTNRARLDDHVFFSLRPCVAP